MFLGQPEIDSVVPLGKVHLGIVSLDLWVHPATAQHSKLLVSSHETVGISGTQGLGKVTHQNASLLSPCDVHILRDHAVIRNLYRPLVLMDVMHVYNLTRLEAFNFGRYMPDTSSIVCFY